MTMTNIQLRNQSFTEYYIKRSNVGKRNKISDTASKISTDLMSMNNVDSYIPSVKIKEYGTTYSKTNIANSISQAAARNNTYYCSAAANDSEYVYSDKERFWFFLMQRDPVYLALEHSYDDARNYLDEAGIKQGFFSVKMGDKEYTHFYTNSKNKSPVQAKYKYDNLYQDLTSGGNVLRNYEAGSVFKIGDKEYTLSENHTLNLAYGDDIYDMQFPSNYKFGQKID